MGRGARRRVSLTAAVAFGLFVVAAFLLGLTVPAEAIEDLRFSLDLAGVVLLVVAINLVAVTAGAALLTLWDGLRGEDDIDGA